MEIVASYAISLSYIKKYDDDHDDDDDTVYQKIRLWIP